MKRMQRQEAVYKWVKLAFGPKHANSLSQRSVRFLEEAIELYHAANSRGEMDPGVALQMAHRLLDYVFARPVGRIDKEIGQVGLTLLSVAAAAEYNAEAEERLEVERVLAIDPAVMAERNRVKNEAGFDAGAYPVKNEEPINWNLGSRDR